MPFQLLGLNPSLVRAVGELGFSAPTPIQTESIPAILRGADVIGRAQTGTGKTLAFALPLLQRLQETPSRTPGLARALVLTPTRELASQVGEVLSKLARQIPGPLKIVVAFGGVSVNPQMMALRGGADVVVATPGRLLDLVEHNALKLSSVRTLVLDEADHLLDQGFAEEVNRVLALLPLRRQNLLFSATFPLPVQTLAGILLRDPVRIEMAPTESADPSIVQRAIEVDPPRRTLLLRHLIQEQGWKRVLVFVATRHAADVVAKKLYDKGVSAVSFHGDLSQGARTQVLSGFKAGQWDVVVTTDLASRGLDIVKLSVVVNYDLPRSPVDYVHRIGRTARAGESGLAVSFVSAETEAHFRLIEKRQSKRVARERVAGFEPAPRAASTGQVKPAGTGGIKGKRPSKKDKLRAAAAKRR